ncbi:DUF7146 domain-containing protein [Halomonas sp. 86]|uniref:DUF7146 domain-containing protein n=1 Tax=unclassified Halomonas TaxID=2609666 RepID=UPI004034E941
MLDDNQYYRAEDVKPVVRGRWPTVLGTLLPDNFKDALERPGKQVPCPVNGGKTRFRFFRDTLNERGSAICNCCGAFGDGLEVLQWANGWDFTEALTAVGEFLQVEPRTSRKKRTVKPSIVIPAVPKWAERLQNRMSSSKALSPERAKSKILKVWEEGISLCSPEAVAFLRYLKNDRGIRLRLNPKHFHMDNLRFHPGLSYYEETLVEKDGEEVSKWVCLGEFPAILGALRNAQGELVTVHRTYLTDAGAKAPVDSPRKMMVPPSDLPVNGCSIKLSEPTGGIVGVCEGKETGWSVLSATGMGLYSLANTSLMEGYEVPNDIADEVHTFCIWADKDVSKAGMTAAAALKEKLEAKGYRVIVFEPSIPIPKGHKSVDWNDVLKSQGVLGFPDLRFLKQQSVRRYA